MGHVDPWFTDMMGDVQVLLRRVFQTENRITFPISASGSGGIEAAVLNPLEEGDECIVCVNGAFSERMAIMAERIAGESDPRRSALRTHGGPGRCAASGQGQENQICRSDARRDFERRWCSGIDDYRKVADELGALLVVDAVATLGGMPLNVDRQRIDICFSGTQKAISAPPGMAPITVNTRVEEVMHARKDAGAELVF